MDAPEELREVVALALSDADGARDGSGSFSVAELQESGDLWDVYTQMAAAVLAVPAVADALAAQALQQRVAEWHARRFPEATMLHVTIKMAEEAGEVASAVLAADDDDGRSTGRGIAWEEAADVAVCLMALLGRWFPDRDLMAEVERKMAVLTDPLSGHRAALYPEAGKPTNDEREDA